MLFCPKMTKYEKKCRREQNDNSTCRENAMRFPRNRNDKKIPVGTNMITPL